MAYEIKLINKEKIIFIRFYDGITSKEYIISRNVLSDIMKANAINRLLVCLKDAVIKSTITEEYLFASEIRKYLPPDARIALIAPQGNAYMEHHRFFETACINRMINLKIFADDDSAVKWLLK